MVGKLKPTRSMGINKSLVSHPTHSRVSAHQPIVSPPMHATFAHPLPILLGGVPRAHAHATWFVGAPTSGCPIPHNRFRVKGLGSGVPGRTCALRGVCIGTYLCPVRWCTPCSCHHSSDARGGPCTHLPNMHLVHSSRAYLVLTMTAPWFAVFYR